MYFSEIPSENITVPDPRRRRLWINQRLFASLQNDRRQNVRVLLDTHLLQFRGRPQGQSLELISVGNASATVGAIQIRSAYLFMTHALSMATFRLLSPLEFTVRYLWPLKKAIADGDITRSRLEEAYDYPKPAREFPEKYIQRYFTRQVEDAIDGIYIDLCGSKSSFMGVSFRPCLANKLIINPDVSHIWIYNRKSREDESSSDEEPTVEDDTWTNTENANLKEPFYCVGLGYFKRREYLLETGFENMLIALNRRRTRNQRIFSNRQWDAGVLFTLVLRKYLYQAFISGTNRVFISDHESFSGFFEYTFDGNGQMNIDYYIINDPETVEHGITLRSVIAGFFYNTKKGVKRMKREVEGLLQRAEATKGNEDLLDNVGRKATGSSKTTSSLKTIMESDGENAVVEDLGSWDANSEIYGNTYCRVEYDSRKNFPRLTLPSVVFVKMYYYDKSWLEEGNEEIEGVPAREEYYEMFFNEHEINKKIEQSQFASNYPKILASGYWNGLGDNPVHIFEYLGEEVPSEEWDMVQVHEVIKSRLKELHSIGISHNDIRIPNIHVSVSLKITLIHFGLSDSNNNEKNKKKDMENLDFILGVKSDEKHIDHESEDSGEEDSDITYAGGVFEEFPPQSHESMSTAAGGEFISEKKTGNRSS